VLARYVREKRVRQFAEGVDWVIVDGHITLDRGALSERLVGQVLAPAR
jgi:hypothetical protein